MSIKTAIKAISVCLVMSALIFVCLLAIERLMLKKYDRLPVIVAACEIPKGTIITEESYDELFKIVEIPVDLVVPNTVTNYEELNMKCVDVNISIGQLIYRDMLNMTEFMLLESPTEVSFSVSDEESAVAGKLRNGDIVDIFIKGTSDRGYTMLMSAVKLAECFDEDFNKIEDDEEACAVNFTLVMEEDDVRNFLDAIDEKQIKVAMHK